MKNRTINAFLSLITLFILTSCLFNEEVEIYTTEATTNDWIYKTMKANYLWLDDIQSVDSYDLYAQAETFYNSLLSDQEKKVRNNKTYWYSYMEQIEPSPTKTRLFEIDGRSYGLELVLYAIQGTENYYARILYVVPGSPAHQAGVRRGMWVLKVDNVAINATNYNRLLAGNGASIGIYEGDYSENIQIQKELSLSAAVVIKDSPILKDTLLRFDNRNVAYLCYTHFSTGPDGFSDKSWDQELKEVFKRFRDQNAQELILDLRFNRGGYLTCAHLLASMIIPESVFGETFCNVSYHSSRKQRNYSLKFDSTTKGVQNLNLNRVYILTSGTTASSSEVVMNGLQANGIMSVIQIGTTTEGKNVGSEEFVNKEAGWSLHPIVASITNKDEFGDYKEGFTPIGDYYYDELSRKKTLGELGTAEDALISRALYDMGLISELPSAITDSRSSNQTRSSDMPFTPSYSSLSLKLTASGILLNQ
ncbi:MAG: S41 family peptidase [Bacteroidales bacterium]